MRAPKPLEQLGIFLIAAGLTDLLCRWLLASADQALTAPPLAGHEDHPSLYKAPDGRVWYGDDVFLRDVRARYGAENPHSN